MHFSTRAGLFTLISLVLAGCSGDNSRLAPTDPVQQVLNIGTVEIYASTHTDRTQVMPPQESCTAWSGEDFDVEWGSGANPDKIVYNKTTQCTLASGGGGLDGGQVAIFGIQEHDPDDTVYIRSISASSSDKAIVEDIDDYTELLLKPSVYSGCSFHAWVDRETNVFHYTLNIVVPADDYEHWWARFIC